MNKEAWDEGCVRGIFGLVLAILIFAPLAFGGVGGWEFLVIQALTIGVAALWALRLWVSPKPQFLWPPIVWPVLAFTLYAIGRYLTSDIEYASRHEFLQVLVFTLLFLAIINNLYNQDMTQTISYTVIAVAMAASSYAVAQYLTHSTRVWTEMSPDIGRASGTFLSPDHFCALLEMTLPLLLSILLVGRVKALTRVLLGYSLLVILAGVSVTFCRAGWISSMAGMLVVLLILLGNRHHRKFAAIILVLLTGGGILFVTRFLSHTLTYMQRVATAKGEVNLDIFLRIKIWTAGLRMWLDHLWWGVGPGLFDWRFDEYRPQSVQLRAGWAHCDYLNLLTDWGLVGGLLVLAGIVLCLSGIVLTWRRVRLSDSDFGTGLSNRYAIFLGSLGGLAALAIHSLVDFSLHVPADALLALTLLAMLTSHLRFATERYWHKIRLPVKLAATLSLLAAMGYLGWQEFRLGNEARWLIQARNVPENTLPRADLLEAAFRCEPMNFENAFYIGDCYRTAAFSGATNSVELAETALRWYQTSQKLNPHFSLNYLRQGFCLDALGQHDQAWQDFYEADTHDPNGYYTAANIGGHYLQTGDYAAAQIWLTRSQELKPINNPVVSTCLPIVNMKLSDDAGDVQ